MKAHFFECPKKVSVVTHGTVTQVAGGVVPCEIIVEMDISEAIRMVAGRLRWLESPEYDVGHIETEFARGQALQESIPFSLTVHEVVHVRVPGDLHTHFLSVFGERVIMRSDQVELRISRGGDRPMGRTFGHEEPCATLGGEFNSPHATFERLLRVMGTGDVGTGDGSDLDTCVGTDSPKPSRGSQLVERFTRLPSLPAIFSQHPQIVFEILALPGKTAVGETEHGQGTSIQPSTSQEKRSPILVQSQLLPPVIPSKRPLPS